MKVMLGCLCFLCTISSLLNALEEEKNDTWVKWEKTYVDSGEVCFVEHSIFVNLNHEWIQTEAIHVDTDGFYFESIRFEDASSFSWTCGVCGKRNEAYRKTCRKCGAEKPSD